MGTPANKEILRAAGLGAPELEGARATDLVIAADVTDATVGESLVAKLDEFLAHQVSASSRSGVRSARSLERALSLAGDANLALVSIPGEHVASEVHRLLDRDIHAFIFSDNVSIEDEVALKLKARERGLLVMGPDCGTGAIGGLPLAFANAVHGGSIGLVAASGTGLQEVMVQIDRLGGGVSHAIGLGGRDLSARVGASPAFRDCGRWMPTRPPRRSCSSASLPPRGCETRSSRVAGTLSKPVVAILLGERPAVEVDGNVHYARTLEETAMKAVELAGTRASRPVTASRRAAVHQGSLHRRVIGLRGGHADRRRARRGRGRRALGRHAAQGGRARGDRPRG